MALGQLRYAHPTSDPTDAHQDDNTAEALAAWGLQPVHPLPQQHNTFHLWPECVEPFNFWRCLQSQWRVGGMGGATGLDYTAVEAAMRMAGIPRSQRALRFTQVCLMESETLRVWDEKRVREASKR